MENNNFMEKKYFDKYKIRLDGEETSINDLLTIYMSGIDDQRVVLAIDAASISSRVSVARDGTVKGLLSKKFTANTNKILSTSIEFANFVKENESDIIK